MNGGRKVFKKVSQNLNLKKKKSGRNFKIEFQNMFKTSTKKKITQHDII